MRAELLSIVTQLVHHFTKDEPITIEEPPLPPPPPPKKVVAVQERQAPIEPLPLPAPSPTISVRQLALETMKESLVKMAPHLKWIEPLPSIFIPLFPHHEKQALDFLHSVADAITAHFMKVNVKEIASEKELVDALQSPFLSLILASFSDIAKITSLVKEEPNAHQKATLQDVPWLVLQPLQSYAQDQNHKRQLWTCLKNTLQSSQTLRSTKL